MIELKSVTKTYQMGEQTVHALNGVSLKIERGEFIAIMGPSGSGKSTLAHILGLLDTPTSGSYLLNGREVAKLSSEDLAILRREEIGFIFQQFNLLSRTSALNNVYLPLHYSRKAGGYERARHLLELVGMGARMEHKPNELSGGQQQRVAIARALINQPHVILADEPTGNLDSQSERDILNALRELNEQGITVIMVTHEESIGAEAGRLIRMRDGKIQSDVTTRNVEIPPDPVKKSLLAKPETPLWRELMENLHQGFVNLTSNKVRTGLSMLGVLIGVAAVVAMLAVGRGAQEAIKSQLAGLGSNLLVLRAGAQRAGGVAQETGITTRLTISDADYLKEEVPLISVIAPNVSGRVQVTFLNRNWNTLAQGVTSAFPDLRASEPQAGRFFTDEEMRTRSRVAIIGVTVARQLFGTNNPIGESIRINKIPFQVIGVLPEKGASGFRDQDDVIMMPVTTAMYRVLGKLYVDTIEFQIQDVNLTSEVQERVLDLMATRHRVPPTLRDNAFSISNMADVQAALSQGSRTMSLLLASIATISLIVGGIGIMNIMLVSVSERTREIGLRKAVGAKRRDIIMQFMAEAIVVSTVGGIGGILLGWTATLLLSGLAGWATSVSVGSVALAFFFSALIGVVFGVYPARAAAGLDPIEALRHE